MQSLFKQSKPDPYALLQPTKIFLFSPLLNAKIFQELRNTDKVRKDCCRFFGDTAFGWRGDVRGATVLRGDSKQIKIAVNRGLCL